MHVLPLNFKILQYLGLWRPLEWSSGWKFLTYECYTVVLMFFYYMFALSQAIDLFASFESVEEFTHGSFLLLTVIGVCAKTINLLTRRKEIIDLTNVLMNGLCKPRNDAEIEIQAECERNARFNAIWYTSLATSTVSLITLRSVIVDVPQRSLPFKGWLPYRLDVTQFGFWFAYIHQSITHAMSAIINGSFDTLVPGLMMQTCAQMKILKYRLKAIPPTIEAKRIAEEKHAMPDQHFESELLAECIKHHVRILEFSDTTNNIFGFVVFIQFAVSSLVLCVSVFEISTIKLFSSQFVPIVMYLNCMLAEIFIFCFYGGELTLQSVDVCNAVYRMDWSSLEIPTRKSLMTIMIRSLRPTTFTCGSVITLSLDSFTSLIKLSYSAYNALQRMSE